MNTQVQISNLQLAFMTGNFLTTATLITLSQALMDVSLQNSWIVVILLYAFFYLLTVIGLSGISKIQANQIPFFSGKLTINEKFILILFIIFLSMLLIRDLRIITDFVEMVLLPTTPTFVITMMFILAITYIAWSGLEVIARFTELFFIVLIGVILSIPITLANQLELESFEPILTGGAILPLLQATFLGAAWIGEWIVVILILGMVKPFKDAKRSILIGGTIALFLLFILFFFQIGVLGAQLVRYSIYPTYSLVQQIILTEFLDRLDLVLVTLYFPSIFAKMALTLFGIYRSISLLANVNLKPLYIPLALLMGLLSIVMFDNKVENFNYAIFTWASIGLMLELVILALFRWQVYIKGPREGKVSKS